MRLYVVNRSRLKWTEINPVIAAVNIQLSRDVERYWSTVVRLVGWHQDASILLDKPEPDRAVIYLQNEADVDGALGYHTATNKGVPAGFVFTDIAEQLNEPWSVTFSHEVLEMLGDPFTNLLAGGPHPNSRKRYDVGHWYELCDAVQSQTYAINSVQVSNFVLPLYFTVEDEGRPVDFLQSGIKSFGVARGGYVGFYDPVLKRHDTFVRTGDRVAKRRKEVKKTLGQARRSERYQSTLERT